MYEKNPLSPHLQIYRWHLSMILSITHRIIGVVRDEINNFLEAEFPQINGDYEIINFFFQSFFGKLFIISLS